MSGRARVLKSDASSPSIGAGDYAHDDDEGAGGRFEDVNVKYLDGQASQPGELSTTQERPASLVVPGRRASFL